MDAVTAVGLGMVDPAHVEIRLEQVPMRDLVGRNGGTGSDQIPGETGALGLPEEGSRQSPTTSLAEHDDDTALPAPVGQSAAINPLFPQVGWPDMASEGGAIHFDLSFKPEAAGLGGHRLPQLVH